MGRRIGSTMTITIPDYDSGPGTEQFHRGLVAEHIEDAAFLYQHRLVRLAAPDVAWDEVASIEHRLTVHIDGIASCGQLGLRVAVEAAPAGPGELFAAVSTVCRSRHAPGLGEILQKFDSASPAALQALTSALKYELPDEWRAYCARAVLNGDEKLVASLAHVLGYRRWQADDVLLQRMKTAGPRALPALLWGLGRAGGAGARSVVRTMLGAEDRQIAVAAFHAAARLEDADSLDYLISAAGARGVDAVTLGLASGRRVVRGLTDVVAAGEASLETVTALALIGDLSAVRPLVDLLSHEEMADAAAEALYVITGAELYEEVVEPDPIDEDGLFEDELALYRATGELPRRSDGEAFGTKVLRLTRDAAVWSEWLAMNASRFVAGCRYRFGRQSSPAVSLECLRSKAFPKAYRKWIAEELHICYRVDVSLECDMFVAPQRRLLAAAATNVSKLGGAFQEGHWYFAGQLIS
jgi:hypothetical protein